MAIGYGLSTTLYKGLLICWAEIEYILGDVYVLHGLVMSHGFLHIVINSSMGNLSNSLIQGHGGSGENVRKLWNCHACLEIEAQSFMLTLGKGQ